MASDISKEQKKEIMKKIILELHKGLSVEEARKKFIEEIGDVSTSEIAEMEQALLKDGLSTDEIKKFCNVHALMFQSLLQQTAQSEQSPAHPLSIFKRENREIEKIIVEMKALRAKMEEESTPQLNERMKDLLNRLKGIDVHYARKEQVLFPYLEKHGFSGPSKVMWGKHNDIRELLRKSLAQVGSLKGKNLTTAFLAGILNPLIEETEGMIFKEENILFPTTMEKLTPDEWIEVIKSSEDVGYVFIEKPKDTSLLISELKSTLSEEPTVKEGNIISLPTGDFTAKELMSLLNTLPVDITFVDKDDRVRYFSESKERIFVRTKAVLGRKVQNCHPPQSLHMVEKILTSFKEGKRNSFAFWIDLMGKLVYIRYFAVRDGNGNYLGTLEVTQDIKPMHKIRGQKRLLDEKD